MPRMYTSRTDSSAYRAHAREVRRNVLGQVTVWVLCAVMAVLLCIAEQTSFAFSGSGTPVIPFLLPAWVMLCGWFSGLAGGAWFGVIIGLFAEAAGGASVYLLPLVFGVIGAVSGLLGRRILRRRFGLYLLYNAVLCLLYTLYRMIVSLISALLLHSALPLAVVVIENSAREALYAWLWALPLYWIAKVIWKT